MALSLDKVKAILIQSTKILSKNLRPEDDGLLLDLMTETAITPDHVTIIKHEITNTAKMQTLLEILRTSPVSSFEALMRWLEKERNDLYTEVKAIQDKHCGLPDDSDKPPGGPESTPPAVRSVKKWSLVTEFGEKGYAEGEFQRAGKIAACNNGDVLVVDFPKWEGNTRPPRRVFKFNSDGKFKLTLNPPEDNPEAHLVSPHDVAITSHNQIAVSDSLSKYVKLFNESGEYLHSFSVLSANDDPDTQVAPYSISGTCNGDILVGCGIRRVVTRHESHDGRLTNTVKLCIQPLYMTTNSKQQIIVCDWRERSVQVVSSAGDTVNFLDSFYVDGEPGTPSGLACDDDDGIYIAVNRFNPADGKPYTGVGHIHQYSRWGRFIRCIISNIYNPIGITWHKNAIYVGNRRSVLVYKQK